MSDDVKRFIVDKNNYADLDGTFMTHDAGDFYDVMVKASDYDRDTNALQQQLDAFKKQSACRWCGEHHFNVSVCSKCAFSNKQEPHYTAQLQQQLEHYKKLLEEKNEKGL